MRPSPTAGQASLEYIAVISLVAAVLAFAGPAVGGVGGIPITGEVARGIRLGICVVAHDYCRAGDAEADRLPPCALGRRITGKDDAVSLGFVRFGGNDDWSASAGSDGSVTLTYTKGGGAGLVAGIGVEAPLKVDVGAEAAGGLKFQEARSWTFAGPAQARRFIAALPRSARRTPTWHSAALGAEGTAAAGARALGLDAAAVSAALKTSDGVRWGPGASTTLYTDLSFSAPDLRLLGLQVTGLGNGRLMAEYTTVGGVPTQLAFRTAVPSKLGNQVTETVRRLDLRNPGNLFAARPLLGAALFRPPTPGYVADLRRTLAWIDTEGTVERATYAVNDSSKSIGFTVKAAAELGFSYGAVRVGQRLLEATARVPGAKERERFDCLDQLR